MIIFYNPQSSAARKPVLPMSLLAVGAVLEGRYDYSIVDGNLDDTPLETLARLLAGAGPTPLLCVTVMPGPQLQQAVPLCRALKERHPDLIVVWGGYFPTQHWDVCLRAPYVDYVVRGHGEYAFLALLERLDGPSREQRPDHLPGLAYRDEQGAPVTNPLAPIPSPRRCRRGTSTG
jgi:anaerobic magnesium-protoporphyrin IX monomethyl ester cyclase